MRLRLHNNKIIIISFIVPFFLYGCWDYQEIEKRGYVLGVAIDKPENKLKDSHNLEYMPLEADGPLYAFTIQIPIISRSQNKAFGQSGGTADKPRDWNLTVVSTTFFEANREYSTRTDYPPFFSHLQAIVINEDAARENLAKLLDMFYRDPEMRRRTKVFITPDKARDVLNVIPKIDDYSSQYLRTLPNNASKTSRLLHKTDLGKVSESMHSNRSYVLPRVVSTQYEIKDAGCAVFKNNKMLGWLDEIKTKYLKIITGYAKGGMVTVNHPKAKNEPIVLEIRKIKTRQKPVVHEDSISMLLDVKISMNLAEISTSEFFNPDNEKYLSELEKLAEEKVKEQIVNTIAFVQKTYGTDVFFFARSMHRYEPKSWERFKDNWDDIFKTMKVTVKVTVNIDQIGLIK